MSADWAAIFGRLTALDEELAGELERSNREREQFEEEQAEEARAGRLGPERQALQRRIDAGQTTLFAALTGADDSPEARKLRELARTNLARLREEMPEDLREEVDEVAEQNGPA